MIVSVVLQLVGVSASFKTLNFSVKKNCIKLRYCVFRKQRRNQDDDDDDEGFFGPALPPGFKKQDDSPPR